MHKASWFLVGGNPDGNGGGFIDCGNDRFALDRAAAELVAKGFRNVRVIPAREFWN